MKFKQNKDGYWVPFETEKAKQETPMPKAKTEEKPEDKPKRGKAME